MFCEYQLMNCLGQEINIKEVIAHSKYWIPGFKFQTLELVVRLIWMCCKWATIDPPNIVPTTSSEFSLYPLSPRTNHSSVLWPLDQSEDRITEPSCPSLLLVRCQQEQEGEGGCFDSDVILLFSPLRTHISNLRLAPWILIMSAHAGRAGWDIVESVTHLLLANSFYFWMHFWHSFISTSLNIWHQFEEKLFFCEIQPALQTTYHSSIKSETNTRWKHG